MDIKAYVMCKVSSGSERETCKTVADFPFVSVVSIIYGEYDLIAEIQVQNQQQLDFIIDKIRIIPSVMLTSTLIVGRKCK